MGTAHPTTQLNPVSAVQKVYDFMVWMFPHLSRYPREHRLALGESIKERTLTVLGEHSVNRLPRRGHLPVAR